jgi:pyruvate ferredoxin oxidoreductase gamma subunit
VKTFVFIARAGQGAKSAANILAKSAALEGKNIQEFPEYGPERMGAPVKSYVKIDDKPIRDFSPIVNPEYIILIDKTLINLALSFVSNNSVLIINDICLPEKYISKYNLKNKVVVIDATNISIRNIKMDKPSTLMIGAVAKIEKSVKLEYVKKVVSTFFANIGKKNVVESNIKALEECYNEAKL